MYMCILYIPDIDFLLNKKFWKKSETFWIVPVEKLKKNGGLTPEKKNFCVGFEGVNSLYRFYN